MKEPEDLALLRGVLPAERPRLLQLARELNIINAFVPFQLEATGRNVARTFSETGSCEIPFQQLLFSYGRIKLPGWAFRIPAGRAETCAVLSSDEKKCFQAAGLLRNPPDELIIRWWQDLATFIRSITQERDTETGALGERLSLQYERSRTGQIPRWISFESNYAGYDILSVNSATDHTLRPIEVKSSSRPMEFATFFVSDNEWNAARTQLAHYRFHLWSFSRGFRLADISAQLVAPHIPDNRQEGIWRSVEIPFLAFADQFVTTECPKELSVSTFASQQKAPMKTIEYATKFSRFGGETEER